VALKKCCMQMLLSNSNKGDLLALIYIKCVYMFVYGFVGRCSLFRVSRVLARSPRHRFIVLLCFVVVVAFFTLKIV